MTDKLLFVKGFLKTFFSGFCINVRERSRLDYAAILSATSPKLHNWFWFVVHNHRHSALTDLYFLVNMFEKKPTGRVTVGTYKAVLDSMAVSYTLKRGPRCRHARLEVSRETGLTAIIPRRYDLKKLSAFLTVNKRWIIGALKKYCTAPFPKTLRSDPANTIPYLGSYLEMVRDGEGLSSIRLKGNKLVVSSGLCAQDLLGQALAEWYRREAARLIGEKVEKTGDRLGLIYRRIALKEMRTRWGSCSIKGNLNFNWKLILMPEPVIDYVVVHELTHLKEMNHGKRFWALVEKECPTWRERRKWLTKNGREYVAAFERNLA